MAIGTRLVVGVDGGASKTLAVIGNQSGEVVGYGKGGSSNYHNIGTSGAVKAIRRAVTDARRDASIVDHPLEIAVVALAAVDSPRDSMIAHKFVKQSRIARSIFVVNDSVAALYAAARDEPGIVVNSGTGSVAAGFNSSGEYARAGGYGYLISDEGSAFDIGRAALVMAFRALDGRAPQTKLVNLLKRRYRVSPLENLLTDIYTNRIGVDEIARLARVVSKKAESDRVCKQILNRAGVSLAELACAVARKLRMTQSRFTVITYGSNFKIGHNIVQPFKTRIKRECPQARFKTFIGEPAVGAYALGLAILNRRLRPAEYRLLNELKSSAG